MTHRYLALLSGLLLLSLVALACNGDGGTATSTPTATASTSPTSSPTTPPTTTATPTGTATPSITASPPETPTATPTPGEAPLFDPALADAVAHAAVLQPNALDAFGSDWVVTERDVFDDRPASETFDATVPECANVIAIFGAADVLSDANRAGRAKLELAQARGTPDQVTVEGSVNVFNNVETPTSVLESFVQGFGATEFAKCFEGTLTNGSPASTTVAVRLVPPTNPAPHGGFAVAIELTLDEGSGPTLFLLENYVWRVSNAGLSVSTTGPANFDGALAAAAIGAVDAGIARVLAGDLSIPPTEEPTDVPCGDPIEPSCVPTEEPTEEPTETPTDIPTAEPGTGVSAALYEADDLPGPEAWTITEDNDFNSGPFDDLETSSDACLSVVDTAGEALARLNSGVVEGAQREYTNSPDGEAFSQGVTASIQVRLYEDATGVDDAFQALTVVVTGEDYRRCLEDTIGVDTVEVARGTTIRSRLTGGLAVAFDITVNDGSVNDLHVEFYWFETKNSVTFVSLIAPPDLLTEEIANVFVPAFQDRLDAVIG